MHEHPEEARDQQILAARARALSRPTAPAGSAEGIDVVRFTLQGEQYAVDLRLVREVYPLAKVTPVPCAPDFVLGILNVRGTIFPLLDLRRFFGLPSTAPGDGCQALLVNGAGLELCLRADTVSEVTSLLPGDLGPPLEAHGALSRHFIRGITSSKLVYLDLEAILADPRLLVEEEVS